MNVRPAQLEDVSACLELDHNYDTDSVWQMDLHDSNGEVTIQFRKVRLPRTVMVTYPRQAEAMVRDWMRRDGFLVAEEGNRVVGYLNMMVQSAPGVAWIADLVVDAAHRRRRVGSTLLAAASRWSRQHHLSRLIIEVLSKNYPAIAFCQSRGLSFCGFNDRYYSHQDIALFFGITLR